MTGLLRKVEEVKDATEVKAHRLVEKRKVMKAGKRKAKEKAKLLKQELQELWVGFSIQKKRIGN